MRDEIIEFLKEAIPEKLDVNVNVPEEDRLGHYSTNVAFKLAKERKKSPFAVAHNIVEELHKIVPESVFHHIEVAEPGFINFWVSEKSLQSELQNILKNKNARPKSAQNKTKIQVEYVSANPTGPLTLANGRGGFLGDVLSNVLEWAGFDVEREYYVNDIGNQVLTLGKSILAAGGLIKGEESFYKGSYIKSWANKHKAILKKNKENPLKLGQIAAADFLKLIKTSLKKADIKFDRYTSEEKNVHKKGFVDKALKEFKNKKLVYKKEGAEWLKTTDFNDDKNRVVITSDGYPTYFLADAGHYLETKLRGFGAKVLILGPDHYGYVSRIQAAAEILGLKNSKIIITQAIRLTKDGKEVKMSKRSGEFATFEELLKEVGTDSARFFFLMHSPNTHMDFDLALAKERSVKNPVYYVQYAYVRAFNILKKSKSISGVPDLTRLNSMEDTNLIRKLVQFGEVMWETAKDYEVQRLTKYASELARSFNNFYENERVVGEEKEIAKARLALVRGTEIIFLKLFKILGVSAPKKM